MVNKKNWAKRRRKESPSSMYCMYCSMAKHIYRAEATSSNEKINSIGLTVIEVHLSEGISMSVQSVSQSVSESVS